MKKKITFLIAAAVMLLTMFASPMRVWADVVTFTPGTNTGATSVTIGDITATMTTMNNASYYQIYANQSGTFSTSNGVITKIEFTCTASGTSKYGPGNASSTVGTYSYSGAVGTWTGSETSVTISSTAQVRMTSLEITYTPAGGGQTTYTVTYDCNGGTSGCPSNVTDITAGASITLAAAPTRTDYTFNGWSDGTTTYGAGDSYTVNGNATMTAQWQLDVDYLFYESFDDCNGTGGNDNQWSGSIANSTLNSDNDDWTFANGSGAYKCAKLGTTSKLGSAQTPAISHTGSATLTFKAAAWNGGSESTTLKLSATSGTLSTSTVTLVKGEWTNYTIDIAGITTSTEIKFEGNANSNSRFFLDEVMVVEATPSTDPSISASDVNITYDAVSGSIAYTINNEPTPVGTLTANTSDSWLNLGTVTSTTVPFTCSANTDAAARTATVTLTYTYSAKETVTKNVTVTQAGNPNIVDNIEDITAAGTYTVKGTIVAMSTRGFVLGDGTGYVYYYYGNNFSTTYTIGDIVKLSGAVTASDSYKVFQFTSSATITAATESNYVAEDPTVISGADMDAQVASTAAVSLSNYIQYQGTLTVNNTFYNITSIDGATTAKGSISYPTNTDFTSLNGKVVTVTGYFVGVSSSQYYNTMIGSIEEVITGDPSIDADNVEIAYDATAGSIAYTINNPVSGGQLTAATTSDWLVLGDDFTSPIAFTCTANDGSERTATVTLTYTYTAKAIVTKSVTVTQATNPNAPGTENNPYTVAQALAASAADGVYVQGTISQIDEVSTQHGNATYWISDDGTTTGQMKIYRGKYLNNEAFTAADQIQVGDIVKITGNLTLYGDANQLTSGNYIVTLTRPVTPSITITPATINEVPCYGGGGQLTVTYANMGDNPNPSIILCDSEGEATTYDWISAQFDGIYTIIGTVSANNGQERTAYLKVCCTVNSEPVCSNIVSITQLAYPTITVATLPFQFDGNNEELANTPGLAQAGLGSSYGDSPKLKFKETGSFVILHFDETPNTLTYNIMGDGFQGTFKVQTSTDGVDYTDLEVYTTATLSESLVSESFDNLGADVRYIRWIYTEATSGKVRLGNIGLTNFEPSITFNPAEINLSAEQHLAEEIPFTYANFEVENYHDFSIQFYNATGQPIDKPDWISVAGVTGTNSEGYKVTFAMILENTGEARSAYFKVYATVNSETVYSNILTLNQAAGTTPPTTGWVLTELADLTDSDVFVIVGTYTADGSSYAMSNDNGTQNPPAAVAVTVSNGTLSGEPDDNIKWNLSGNATDGYTFYPNGSTNTWLYCNTTAASSSNNNIRVGTGDRKVFELDSNGYLVTNDDNVDRYLSIYVNSGTAQDWRGYINTDSAPTIAFYKKVEDPSTPAITVTPATVTATTEEIDGTLAITYSNLDITDASDFDIQFYDGNGDELTEGPDWIAVEIEDASSGAGYVVSYLIEENTGAARNAYFKVYALDSNTDLVYSNLVTVNQAAYVVDYATLPFEWEGGASADFLALNGVTANGLGSDYAAANAPYLIKFDGDGDYIQVKTDSQPGIVTIGVKMIGGNSTSYITVQGSTDGETFDEGEDLTISGAQNDILTLTSTRTFDADMRYVRLYFTKGSNVGVGPITIEKHSSEPYITVATNEINVTAAGEDDFIGLTYGNIEITQASDFGVQFYDIAGDEIETPDWIDAEVTTQTGEEGYFVYYVIGENTGNARIAYFKVFAEGDADFVYSNLVTVNQAAPSGPAEYVLVTDASQIVSGMHYIITNGTDGNIKAMGVQNSNNRAATDVTASNGGIDDIAEAYVFVINGTEDHYTIYDKEYPGYLYAASKGSNYLKTRAENSDGNSEWTITIDSEGKASIVANGENTRNTMRYNSGSTIFSCYDATNSQQDIYLFVKDDDANLEYYGCDLTVTNLVIEAGESITIGAGSTMTVTGTISNDDNPDNLVIADGGQFIYDDGDDFYATQQKDITSWNAKGVSGWYLIASPAADVDVSGLIGPDGTYDLFWYNEPTYQWCSHNGSVHPFNSLDRGWGYLYANVNDVTLNFSGVMKPTNSQITVPLSHEGSLLTGFNLLGNPFTRELGTGDMKMGATEIETYYFSEGGDKLEVLEISEQPIKPGRGFMIQTSETDPENALVFNPTTKGNTSTHGYIKIMAGNDNAFIKIGGGNTLRKMNIANTTKVYVMNDDKDYAAARVEELAGTMPVHFKAAEDGEYTITIEAVNADVEYMHLIDNFTGNDIDLLLESSYTFNATTNDSEARFRLDFGTYGVNEIAENNTFAYQYGNEIVVNGEGELQIFDLMGRMIMNTKINGVQSVNVPSNSVYILKLNNNIQKIVVK